MCVYAHTIGIFCSRGFSNDSFQKVFVLSLPIFPPFPCSPISQPIKVIMFHYSISSFFIYHHQVLSSMAWKVPPVMPTFPWETLHKSRRKKLKSQHWWRTIIFARHKKTAVHINSQHLWHHAQDLHKLKQDKFSTWREQVVTEYHHCLRSYWLLIADLLGEGELAFLKAVVPDMSNMFQWMITPLKLYRQYKWGLELCFVF